MPDFVADPDGSSVAFVAYDSGFNYRVWGRPIDGSAPAVRLDPGLTWVFESTLAVAPDRRVLFRAHAGDGMARLYAAPIDGSAPPVELSGPLVSGGNVGDFALVPGSDRVVYAADALVDGRTDLFRASLDGGGPIVRLDHELAADGDVTRFEIGLDGAHVVYWAREGGVQQVYSVPTDRSRRPLRLNDRLVAGGNVRAGYPLNASAISPDGRRVVFVADARVDGVDELFSVPVDGTEKPHLRRAGEPRVVRLNGALPQGEGITWYRFAPDVGRLIYLASAGTSGADDLFSVPIEGGIPLRLNDGLPLFVPPTSQKQPMALGSRAAFVSGHLLYGVPLTGGTPQPLTPETAIGPPAGQVFAYHTSPDERWTVYLAMQDALGVVELYSVPTGGGVAPVKLNPPLPPGGTVGPFGAADAFAITPDGTRVVYVADQDVNDDYELYVVPIDASAPAQRLGSGADVGNGFVLTAAPEQVAFRRVAADGVGRIFVQPLDGSAAPRELSGTLVTGGHVVAFAVTPDGARVVFRADAAQDGRFELFTAPTDGSAPRARLNPMLDFDRDVTEFELTSDSARVVFLADARVNDQFELYGAPVDAGQAALELDPLLYGTRVVLRFAVAPDSSRVAFVADPGTRRLYSVPCDGSAPPVQLNAPLAPGSHVNASQGGLAISPDSRWVAYLADGSSSVALHRVALDGTQAAVLLDEVSAVLRPLLVTADSRRVVYGARAGFGPFELFSLPLAGGSPARLSGTPTTFGVSAFALDPHGRRALFVVEPDSTAQPRLFHVLADGSSAPRAADAGGGHGIVSAGFSAHGRHLLFLDALEADLARELFALRLPVRPWPAEPPTDVVPAVR